MKKFEEMKKDNKGFSLVELIVVIAIMVVLVAVLGSTILGYVEESRYSRDIQGLDAIKTGCTVMVADPDSNWTIAAGANGCTLQELMNVPGETAGTLANQELVNTLAEVFDIPADGSAAEFNSASAAFEGLTSADVHIRIVNGAVSIIVPVQADQAGDFDPYTVGNGFDGVAAAAGWRTFS